MASDGTRLNLAAQLAETAAGLEKAVSVRRARASDPAIVSALADVEAAVRSLSSAVRTLAAVVSDDA